MPSHVAATAISPASAVAQPGRLVSRKAVAAGPTSSAVDKIVPIVSADNATASAIAMRHAKPTSRTGMPRATARSEFTELSNSGRYPTSTMPSATTLRAATSGITPLLIVKGEPNKTVIATPLVLVVVASQYRNSAASPSPAP